jgi:hypothetical protein
MKIIALLVTLLCLTACSTTNISELVDDVGAWSRELCQDESPVGRCEVRGIGGPQPGRHSASGDGDAGSGDEVIVWVFVFFLAGVDRPLESRYFDTQQQCEEWRQEMIHDLTPLVKTTFCTRKEIPEV